MPGTKQRRVTANSVRFRFVRDNNAVDQWKPDLARNVLFSIYNSPPCSRLSAVSNWFFYLDYLEELDNGNLIIGWFKSGRNVGLLPPVVDVQTLVERDNPRTPTEGEAYNTHFVLRMPDGLLLLEKGGHEVVTLRRIEDYIETHGKNVLLTDNVHSVHILPLVSRDFLERIQGKFRELWSVDIRIDTINGYRGQSEAIKSLQEEIEPTNANYITIGFGARKRRGSLRDLKRISVVEFLRRQLADESHILSARVWGKTYEGTRDYVDFWKIEEKYLYDVPLDEKGLVISHELLESMVRTARERDRLE